MKGNYVGFVYLFVRAVVLCHATWNRFEEQPNALALPGQDFLLSPFSSISILVCRSFFPSFSPFTIVIIKYYYQSSCDNEL